MKSTNYDILTSTKYRNGPAMLATSEAVTQEVSAPMCSKSIPNSTTESIPHGYCHCGCGQKTKIIDRADSLRGRVKGEPYRFIFGHQSRKPPIPLEWSDDQGCYLLTTSYGDVALVDEVDAERVGKFRWNSLPRTKGNYVCRTDLETRKCVYLHRFILDAPDGMMVDHINGDRLDNRRENLRLASPAENSRNIQSLHPRNTSGFTGVSLADGKWKVSVRKDGRDYRIGLFECKVEAAIARDIAALELHGEFASLNFPELRMIMSGVRNEG